MQREIQTEALQIFTAEEASYYKLLPCRKMHGNILECLGEAHRDYSDIIAEIKAIYGFEVEIETVSTDELSRLMSVHYRRNPKAGATRIMADSEDSIAALLSEAFSMNASDIHLEPMENRCRVRFRIDGRLIERHVIESTAYPAVVNRIKIMSGLDISEKRLPQDGRILYSSGNARFDIRTSVMPTIHGEKIVLRLLVSDRGRLSLEELGFDDRQYRDYTSMVSLPHGMILISGPTGSGKSTTLYAKEDIGLTFPVALRTFLRQDPDIIMLGEIRDGETAEMAVRSSLTGHLLLSTLHTNSAWGCITRLTDMGIHPYLLSETLAACVAQRLVRLLCPHCKRPIPPPEDFLQHISIPDNSVTFEAAGCEKCYFTGYSGRIAIYEVIAMDRGLKEAVRNGTADEEMLLKERDIRTLKDSALSLYLSGRTSLEEIYPILSFRTA